MGQQQILLIVIATIIAWQVILGSMRYIDSVNQGNERDLLTDHMKSLVVDAINYKLKPTTMGGGNGSMAGFQPAKNKSVTDLFRINTGSTDNEVVFSGYGSVAGMDNETPVHVILTYSSQDKKISIDIIN
jgi:hypothetical protein